MHPRSTSNTRQFRKLVDPTPFVRLSTDPASVEATTGELAPQSTNRVDLALHRPRVGGSND